MVKRKHPKSRDVVYPWDTCGKNLQEKDLQGLPEICRHLFKYNTQLMKSIQKQESVDWSEYEEMNASKKEDRMGHLGKVDKG